MGPPPVHTAARPIEYILSGISSTSAIITTFIRSVRASHADLSAITRELSDLRLLLELLKDEPGIPLQLQAQMLLLLESCGNILIRIDSILDHCNNASRWTEEGQPGITMCRGNLEIFREALALALEVVNLPTGSPGEADATRRHIEAEIGRLQPSAVSNESSTEERVLALYLDAVATCLHGSLARRRSDQEAADDTTGTHRQTNRSRLSLPTELPRRENTDAEENPGPVRPSEKSPAGTNNLLLPRITRSRSPGDFDQPPQGSAPAYSPRNVPLPYYTEEPETLPHAQYSRSEQDDPEVTWAPSHPRPESPTLPTFPGDFVRVPTPQQSPPPASETSRKAWKAEHGSPSAKSEPFPGGTSYLDIDSPTSPLASAPPAGPPPPARAATSPDIWTERLPLPGPGFKNRHNAREHSISSTFSVGPISRLVSSIASSAFRSGSPGPPSGASTPMPVSPLPPSSPPPPFSPTPGMQRSPTPASPTPWANPATPRSVPALPPVKKNPHHAHLDISPTRHLTDKNKNTDILHIDTSPTSLYVATRHAKLVKIWSIPKNALHGTVKITSYVQPQVRSREYYIRSHAFLSESTNLIAITTHFGLTLEIYNFTKGGSGAKKVQVIDDAHRWAASQCDAYQVDYAPLVVYRPKDDRIDRYFLARHPGATKPFWEDSNHSIYLQKSGLPFLPKFPELAYSSDSPLLVAAAGPRPGDAPRPHAIILVAWLMTAVSDSRLRARSPAATVSSLGSNDEERHKPYRVTVPEFPALQSSLPSCLVARGSLAVSIWIPANHTEIPLPGGKFRRQPIPAPERFVLVWDIPANTTRILSIPNVQACVSPDCRRVAYCDPKAGCFVILDVGTGEEMWRYPGSAAKGFASFGGQLENLSKVTVFEFSPDSKKLIVGDTTGAVGVYEVTETGPTFELAAGGPGIDMIADSELPADNDHRLSNTSMLVPVGWQAGTLNPNDRDILWVWI